ncbi:unnamed protein product [Penicillium roqueforti FM164]|uniref:Genomic scaffold, ProqFM164S03 n=1 Tax=Penicillium roqueforti (strain FM164) TaxID=1365484 RepID=W6QDR3_PENRF|nr:unnamed protein product [Penicillium roqueforti FM164]
MQPAQPRAAFNLSAGICPLNLVDQQNDFQKKLCRTLQGHPRIVMEGRNSPRV